MSSGASERLPRRPDHVLLLYAAPVLLLLGLRLLPLATGARTLYLRDVFGTHLEMKAAQAEEMRAGRLPLLDATRAGGQPALGNPDSVPLYPDNLLFLAAPVLWALNAHFWIHALLAPLSMYALARAWGLRREAAWAAGTCYALGGYALSHLMLYNQVAGMALAPALAAACLRAREEDGPRLAGPAAGALWALLILGGEPFLALLALALALGSTIGKGVRVRPLARLGLFLALGTAIAAPQIVELLRIVGASYRGQAGYSAEVRTAASWDPRQIVEWILPFAFGRPDRLDAAGFWGFRFFTGHPPYYFSLYPGLLALALAAAAVGRGGRVARGPIALVLTGLFLALGRFNPAVAWLFEAAGGLLRYPVRTWLPVAVGGALLAGIGFERALLDRDRGARRLLHAALATLAGAFLLIRLGLWLGRARIETLLAGFLPDGSAAASASVAVSRWGDLASISLAVLAALSAAAILAARLPKEGGALLLTLHAAAQILLLAPLLATDSAEGYRLPPAILQAIPAGRTVAHGGSEGLFGARGPEARVYPGAQGFWFARRAYQEGYPFAGALWGRRYELNVSSEGLDSFLSTAARDAVRLADDATRLRLLAAWGADYLILDRPLDPAAASRVDRVLSLPSAGGSVDLYRIRDAAPPVVVAGAVVRAASLNDAVARLSDPAFDPRSAVVLPGDPASVATPARTPPGDRPARIQVLDSAPERLAIDVETEIPAVVVVQRAFQPIYLASVDDRRVAPRIANLHRIGIEIPAGRHRVALWTDRGPLRASLLLSLAGLAGLFAPFLLSCLRAGAALRGGPASAPGRAS